MKHVRQVLRRTLDPVWKERFEIRVYSDSSSILEISVYDYEEFGFSDNFIGRFVLIVRAVQRSFFQSLFASQILYLKVCIPKFVSQRLYPNVCIPKFVS